MRARKSYSVPEVASICGVCNKTVMAWIDAGHLVGSEMPAGPTKLRKNRRVSAENLRKFLVEFDLVRSCGLYATLSPVTCPVLSVLRLFVDIDHFTEHIEDRSKYLGVLGAGGEPYDAEAADPVKEAARLFRATQ